MERQPGKMTAIEKLIAVSLLSFLEHLIILLCIHGADLTEISQELQMLFVDRTVNYCTYYPLRCNMAWVNVKINVALLTKPTSKKKKELKGNQTNKQNGDSLKF